MTPSRASRDLGVSLLLGESLSFPPCYYHLHCNRQHSFIIKPGVSFATTSTSPSAKIGTWLDKLSLNSSESLALLLVGLVLSQQPPLLLTTSSSSLNEQNIQPLKVWKWLGRAKPRFFERDKTILFLSTFSSSLLHSACAATRGSIHLQKAGVKCQDFEIQPRLLFCQWSSSPPSARSRCTSRSRSPRTVGRTAGSTWTINFLDSSCFCKNVKDVCNRWCKDIPQALKGHYFLPTYHSNEDETYLKTWHRAQHFSETLQTWSAPRGACEPCGRSPQWRTCR